MPENKFGLWLRFQWVLQSDISKKEEVSWCGVFVGFVCLSSLLTLFIAAIYNFQEHLQPVRTSKGEK